MSESTADNGNTWPAIIDELPEADLPIDGLHGRILKCGDYSILFLVAAHDVTVPKHQHEAQWGIVLAGSMEITIGDSQFIYQRGDMHYIPAHVDHSAVIHAGWRGLYIFKRRDSE